MKFFASLQFDFFQVQLKFALEYGRYCLPIIFSESWVKSYEKPKTFNSK